MLETCIIICAGRFSRTDSGRDPASCQTNPNRFACTIVLPPRSHVKALSSNTLILVLRQVTLQYHCNITSRGSIITKIDVLCKVLSTSKHEYYSLPRCLAPWSFFPVHLFSEEYTLIKLNGPMWSSKQQNSVRFDFRELDGTSNRSTILGYTQRLNNNGSKDKFQALLLCL